MCIYLVLRQIRAQHRSIPRVTIFRSCALQSYDCLQRVNSRQLVHVDDVSPHIHARFSGVLNRLCEYLPTTDDIQQ
jgi:hypothetical protein